jgi:hypothetical protein
MTWLGWWLPKFICVKGLGWLYGLDEQGILDKDCSWNIIGLNFEFLLVLNHDDAIWDYPKMGDIGKNIFILDTQFWKSMNSYRYFVVNNHRFCFLYTINFILLFRFHFNKKWNFVVILIEFLVKQINTNFYGDFHIYIVVWIYCSIKNVMKWIPILSLDFSTL